MTPGKGGQSALDGRVPVYDTMDEAVRQSGANASCIFVPAAGAPDAMLEAAEAGIGLIFCITEGIPALDMLQVYWVLRQRGVRAEAVAQMAAAEAKRYLESGAPVGEHLADQLLIPMALAAHGSFVTGPLSPHTTTNIDVIRKFLDVDITIRPLDERRFEVTVSR